jgi:3-oxoacyl-[acyl-carrier-protein] synthase II
MSQVKAVIVAGDIVTPYGWGTDACWEGLMSGNTAIGPIDRFSTQSFKSHNAAVVADLSSDHVDSLAMQMLSPLLKKSAEQIPPDSFMILATTVGEIDLLERAVIDNDVGPDRSRPDFLLQKVQSLAGTGSGGMVVSAACASSSAAIARAAAKIKSGECDSVLVVACDCVSEFVFAGFSALMALESEAARPFDKDRSGLSLGEAAGYVLLMSDQRALNEDRPVMAQVAGWGLTSDANHMTGPSRDGTGLALAIEKSLLSAGVSKSEVGPIAAHGTGTVYNDSMEIKALKLVFDDKPLPTYSIKGGIGHTLGAAGLIETVVAIRSLEKKAVPPTVNIQNVDDEARGWVSPDECTFKNDVTVSINAGFGGINAALVLKN